MKIAEVSGITGLTKRAIRFYIECGLVNPETVTRNFKEYREYSGDDVERLRTVAVLRDSLFSIEQIREMLEYPERIPALLEGYHADLRRRHSELDELLEAASALPLEASRSAEALACALRSLPSASSRRLDMTPRFRRYDAENEADVRDERDRRYFRPAFAVFLGAALILSSCVCGAMWRDKTGEPALAGRRYAVSSVYNGAVRRIIYAGPEGDMVQVTALSESLQYVEAGYLATTARSRYAVTVTPPGGPETAYIYDGSAASGKTWLVGKYDTEGFAEDATLTADGGESVSLGDYSGISGEARLIIDAITAYRNYSPLSASMYPALLLGAGAAGLLWLWLKRYF